MLVAGTPATANSDKWRSLMSRIVPLLAVLVLAASAANAQTPPSTAPSGTPSNTPAQAAAPSPAPAAAPSATTALGAPTLTDEQAKTWVGKTIYSSDQKNMGEVVSFQRDSSGKVTEMQADIGGFLGFGETRVRVPANQFKLDGEKVVLNLNQEQVKALPKVAK
jgi:hypothetical protein